MRRTIAREILAHAAVHLDLGICPGAGLAERARRDV